MKESYGKLVVKYRYIERGTYPGFPPLWLGKGRKKRTQKIKL